MINVTIGESKTQSEKPFPKIMKSKYSGAIVFFISNERGYILVEGRDIKYDTSEFGWAMNNFTDFNEPITLQNA